MTVTAVTQLSESDVRTTWNSERQNSPVLSCDVPIAANPRMAMAVAPNSGTADCFTTSDAARFGSTPFSMRISIPSTTTMALSTSMPSAMISAPSEMRSRATPIGPRKMNVPAIVSRRMKPIRRPLRTPMKNSSTTTDDRDGLQQAVQEARDRGRDRLGLQRHHAELDAERKLTLDLAGSRHEGLAHRDHVAPADRGDSERQRAFAVVANQMIRRIHVVTPDRSEVAQQRLAAAGARDEQRLEVRDGRSGHRWARS